MAVHDFLLTPAQGSLQSYGLCKHLHSHVHTQTQMHTNTHNYKQYKIIFKENIMNSTSNIIQEWGKIKSQWHLYG